MNDRRARQENIYFSAACFMAISGLSSTLSSESDNFRMGGAQCLAEQKKTQHQ